METSLHRQLKALYGGKDSQCEVRLDQYRIDAIDRGRLIEIQQASLGAIRDKIRRLLETHRVLVVKPLAARKRIVWRDAQSGQDVSARQSPRRETWYDVFDDLVHFVNVFPHPRLSIEVIKTVQDEYRVPMTRRRRRAPQFRVVDRTLVGLEGRLVLRTKADLVGMLPPGLEQEFTTVELAKQAGISRWLAQKMAYCLRKTEAVELAGKRRNALVYRVPSKPMRTRRPRRVA